MKKFMIIDGSSLLYRAFFAVPGLKSALGVPTNAVYGFLNMFIRLYENIQPDMIAVTFDKSRATFRTELYSDYKGNREKAPDDLKPQFELIKDVLQALGIFTIELDGYEGDDLIGSLSKKFGSTDLSINIVSGDRDTLQLVDEFTTVYITKRGITEMNIVTPANIELLYGYKAHDVIELKALMGDSSDNIPGVKGIGEKKALGLIGEYSNLEGIYKNIDSIKGKMQKDLLENKELAYLSRELATIKTDVDLNCQPSDFVVKTEEDKLINLLEKLGLHRLTPTLLTLFNKNAVEKLDHKSTYEFVEHRKIPANDFANKQNLSIIFKTVNDVPELELAELILSDGKTNYLITPENIDYTLLESILNNCSAIITNDSKKLFHALYGKCNLPFLKEEKSHLYDLQLMAYLLDPSRNKYDDFYLCERFETPLISDDVDRTNLEMAIACHKMLAKAKSELELYNLTELYTDIELPLVETLGIMEHNGVFIDQERLNELKSIFSTQLKNVEKSVYNLAGVEFNINSPKQLGQILFEHLGLPGGKKTKTGYSTNAEVLEELRDRYPIVSEVLEYRGLSKLLSTYIVGLYPLIDKKTQRIHTNFNQMVTATGRLSSSNPNLQNIPVRTERGKAIRSVFKPGKGFDYLVSADYSQIELRVLAHLSQDATLIEAFKNGEDIHRHTASKVFNKSLDEVTSAERSQAKAVNFGIVYGISEFGLAQDLGIDFGQAAELINGYYAKYPVVKEFINSLILNAKTTGYVKTLFGRRRVLNDINAKNYIKRSMAERMAMNTPIQGTAADIMKLAMNKVAEKIKTLNLKSQLLLQVHDELVLEVPENEVEIVEKMLKETMETVISFSVPLVVDVHRAKNWAEIK